MKLASLLAAFALSPGLAAQSEIELVESAPVETTLDHEDLRNADVVWLEMIGRAQKSLDLAQFYVSDQPGSRLSKVLEAIDAAAARGVRVRVLADSKFAATYPETLDHFAAQKNCEVRRWDVSKSFGGVLHAKYFIVDAGEVFVGSQNFDWRSLEHIVELGIRIKAGAPVRDFASVFEFDWRLAGGATRAEAESALVGSPEKPERVGDALVSAAFSPREGVRDETWWDLPRLIALIDTAKRSVRVELLTYKMADRDLGYWDELETALRKVAGRGVKVELLVADWCKRKWTIEGLQSLEPLPNFDVSFVTIPPHSSGHIPYARVAHAKFVVVDGERAWLGTSNWEHGYFYESRNAGLFIDGGDVPKRLERFFVELWGSKYAARLDACATYEVPKIGE